MTAEDELKQALLDTVCSLAAAISLLERTKNARKAAPSNRMFDMMLADYRRDLENARATLKKYKDT